MRSPPDEPYPGLEVKKMTEDQEVQMAEDEANMAQYHQQKVQLRANMRDLESEIKYYGYDSMQLARSQSKTKQQFSLRQTRSPAHFATAGQPASPTSFMRSPDKQPNQRLFESQVSPMVPPIGRDPPGLKSRRHHPKQNKSIAKYPAPFSFPSLQRGDRASRSAGGARQAAAGSQRQRLLRKQRLLRRQDEMVEKSQLLTAEQKWRDRYYDKNAVTDHAENQQAPGSLTHDLDDVNHTPRRQPGMSLCSPSLLQTSSGNNNGDGMKRHCPWCTRQCIHTCSHRSFRMRGGTMDGVFAEQKKRTLVKASNETKGGQGAGKYISRSASAGSLPEVSPKLKMTSTVRQHNEKLVSLFPEEVDSADAGKDTDAGCDRIRDQEYEQNWRSWAPELKMTFENELVECLGEAQQQMESRIDFIAAQNLAARLLRDAPIGRSNGAATFA